MCYQMQLQLQSLMETLSSTEPHYIRCVKPNNVLKPAIFENSNIIQQLRCGVSILHFVSVLVNLKSHVTVFRSYLSLLFPCRVFLRQLGLAVLDIRLDGHFMNFFSVSVSLPQRFWKESECQIPVII